MDNGYTADKLDDVADMLSGGTPRKSNEDYWNGSIPWLTPKDMGRWWGVTESRVTPGAIGNGTRLAPKESIFIAVRGMSLHNEIRIIRPDRAIAFNQDIKAIVTRKGINPVYLYYVMVSRKPELLDVVEAAGHGTGRLPTDKLKNMRIPRFHSLTEAALAEFFATLDRRIELNRRLNQTLEATARAIFKDWFVDFGPTRAKAKGRAPYLAPELWQLFPNAIDDIPSGWKAGNVSDIALNIRDGRRADDVADDARYVGLEHFDRRKLTLWRYGLGSEVTSNKSGFQTGDLLFGKLRPYFHKVAIAPFPGVCSTDVLVIRPKNSDVACLVYLALSEPAVIDFVTSSSTGTRMPRTNWKTLASYRMAVPDGSIAREFHKIVSPMVQRMTLAAEEAGTLAELRDLLLPRLISGKLRVGDAEEMVAAAV